MRYAINVTSGSFETARHHPIHPNLMPPTKNKTDVLAAEAVSRFCAQLASSSAFPALDVRETGALLCLAQLVALRGVQARLARADLIEYLAVRGLAGDDAELALRGLTVRGLVEFTDAGNATLPLLRATLQGAQARRERRLAGWEKRRATPVAEQAAPAAPVIAATPIAPIAPIAPAPEAVVDPLASPATDPAPVPAKRAKRAATAKAGVLRVSTGDTDTSAVAVCIPCEGDATAELTTAYLEHLATVYQGADVHAEALKAAQWCRDNPTRRKRLTGVKRFLSSWLSRAAEKAETRRAVISAERSRAGFGQGGQYDAPAPDAHPMPNGHPVPDDTDDGLGDLESLVALAPVAPAPRQPESKPTTKPAAKPVTQPVAAPVAKPEARGNGNPDTQAPKPVVAEPVKPIETVKTPEPAAPEPAKRAEPDPEPRAASTGTPRKSLFRAPPTSFSRATPRGSLELC